MQTASRRADIEQKLPLPHPPPSLFLSPSFHAGIPTGSRRVCRSTTYAMLCTNFMHVQCVKHLKRHRAAQLGSPSPTSASSCHLSCPLPFGTAIICVILEAVSASFVTTTGHLPIPLPSPASCARCHRLVFIL